MKTIEQIQEHLLRPRVIPAVLGSEEMPDAERKVLVTVLNILKERYLLQPNDTSKSYREAGIKQALTFLLDKEDIKGSLLD